MCTDSLCIKGNFSTQQLFTTIITRHTIPHVSLLKQVLLDEWKCICLFLPYSTISRTSKDLKKLFCILVFFFLLTRNVEVVGSSNIKGPRCFHEQETLPLLLSTGWFQERI